MKYQVFTTEKAEEDLNSIADYLIYKLLAGETALKQIDRIEQAVMSLEEMPERYRIYDKERGIRVISVDNYLVFYIIDNDNKTVTVISIMYGKRDIESHLSQEKKTAEIK